MSFDETPRTGTEDPSIKTDDDDAVKSMLLVFFLFFVLDFVLSSLSSMIITIGSFSLFGLLFFFFNFISFFSGHLSFSVKLNCFVFNVGIASSVVCIFGKGAFVLFHLTFDRSHPALVSNKNPSSSYLTVPSFSLPFPPPVKSMDLLIFCVLF